MKKTFMIWGAVVLMVAMVVFAAISQSYKWSQRSFDAIVEEIVTQPDGKMRLIVERTTEIYGSPINSLGIEDDTKLFDVDGKTIAITDFQPGEAVKVTLKDAFTEETPFYYPTVYEIRVVDADQ